MTQKSTQKIQETDQELIKDIKAGSEAAFEKFVSKYEHLIYGFGMKVCGNVEDAKDVMQETFLKAFKSLETLKSADALKTWLYRVATNACFIKRRRGKFEPDRILSLNELRPSQEELSHSVLSDIQTRPDDAVLKQELSNTIRHCILSIPPKYSIVLILRDMEGLSAEETGRVLNLTIPTVKIRLHRARLAFKKVLEKQLRQEKGKKHGKVQRTGKM